MKTNDRQLTELMKEVDSGAAQLPDFQRGRLRMMESAAHRARLPVLQRLGQQSGLVFESAFEPSMGLYLK